MKVSKCTSKVTTIAAALCFAINLGCANGSDGGRSATHPPAPSPTAGHPSTPAPPTGERISPADAKREFDSGTAVFIDTRAREAFETQRIPGALSIQISEIDTHIEKLPKGKKIIVYCS